MEILAFLAGMVWYYSGVCSVLYCCVLALFFRPRMAWLGSFLFGLSWASFHQWLVVPANYRDQPVAVLRQAVVIARVVSVPISHLGRVDFDVLASIINGHPTHALLRLVCFEHCPVLQVGEQWRFKVTLKPVVNLGNPGGLNRVLRLHARHIYWLGTLTHSSAQRLASASATPSQLLLRLRYRLANRLKISDPDPNTHCLLQALTLGLTADLDQAMWSLLRRTGTTHLMIISGAHIGLVAGLTYTATKRGWRCWGGLVNWLPASRAAAWVSVACSGIYVLLAGLGIPAQRAWVAYVVLMLRHFLAIRFTAWQAWRYALACALIAEPHACLFPGFYLSFTAAAILIATHQSIAWRGIQQLLLLQLMCLVGLMPLTLYLFSYASVIGFFANALAIPWVSMVIIPFGLLATLLGACLHMDWLAQGLHYALSLLLFYLHWIDGFAAYNLAWSFTQLTAVLAVLLALAVGFCLPLPRVMPAVFVIILSALCPRHSSLNRADVQIAIVDVGQGLAVVVRTATHVLVYDTGVQFMHGGDMAQTALIPYLRTLGVKRLDAVVISHPDLDHRGGLASLAQAYPIDVLLVDNPALYQGALPCHAYPDWEWDGVSLHFFPLADRLASKNNRSCVLQIKNARSSVLLTGDIEHPAEAYLLEHYGEALRSSVLLVPHHGSKTSSTAAFVAAVAPDYAVVSYGFANRYHFPHPQAMRAYAQQHIPVLDTVNCGLIQIDLLHGAEKAQVNCTGYNRGGL